METEVLVGLLLRILPALVVFVLAFVAAADKKTRERWGNLLYQVGSVRPDQRDDPKVGSGVKWPFFVVALGLLLWPIQFYRHASIIIDATQNDLKPQTAATGDLTQTDNVVTVGTENAATENSVSATTPAAGDLQPATPNAAPDQPSGMGDLQPATR